MNNAIPPLPPLFVAYQSFPRPRIEDIEAHLQERLSSSGVTPKPGTRVAIAVGSRGIANLSTIVAGVVRWISARGAYPFIVPAMGSHGGAHADGQKAVLEGYGITESKVGAPILSSMDVVELPSGNLPVPACFDKHAYGADATILINRVKVHTDYHGPYESGLMKMAAIGLGKHKAALAIHRLGVPGLREIMPCVARHVLEHANIVLGIALVENAYEETCRLEAIPAAQIPAREGELLAFSRSIMPRLPIDDVDILIVDEIGKDISGVGLDPNIIGRVRIAGEPEPESPRIKTIVIRNLTAASKGNALGMGLADIMTRKLRDKIDWNATYENAMTSTFLERVKLPIVVENDAQALTLAQRTCGSVPVPDLRIIRIANTLSLNHLLVSPGVIKALKRTDGLKVLNAVEQSWENNALSPMAPLEEPIDA